MTKSMTKNDWILHTKQWALSGLSVAKYCAMFNINVRTARDHFNTKTRKKIVDDVNAEQNQSQQGFDANPSPQNEPDPQKRIEAESRKKRGGQPGNKNAFVHGKMTEAFGELARYADQVDNDFKIKFLRCAQLDSLNFHIKYKQDLAALQEAIEAKGPNYQLTELEAEKLEQLERYITSCLNQVVHFASKEVTMAGQMANTGLTKAGTTKNLAQVKQIRVDTKLKDKSITLAEVKTLHTKAQIELAKSDLEARRKESLSDDDDLGLVLDDVLELGDDEILERFKHSGGELGPND